MAPPPPDPVFTLRGFSASINTLHFHCATAGRPVLYSGSDKGLVHVWNLNSRRAENVLDGHNGASVIWVRTVPSMNSFLSQARDMRVCVWDLQEARRTVTRSIWTGSVGFCRCSLLDGGETQTLLAVPAENMEEIKLVDLRSQVEICSLIPDLKPGMLMCMKIWQGDSGPLLCAGYEDGSLKIWDVSCRRPLSSLKVHSEPVMCLDFDVFRQKGVCGSSDENLFVWNLDAQHNLHIQHTVPLTNPGVSQLCVRGDAKILAAAGWDGNVRVFSWKKLRPLAVLQHHKDLVHAVAFSDHPEPAERLMAAGSKDQRISLWSIYPES